MGATSTVFAVVISRLSASCRVGLSATVCFRGRLVALDVRTLCTERRRCRLGPVAALGAEDPLLWLRALVVPVSEFPTPVEAGKGRINLLSSAIARGPLSRCMEVSRRRWVAGGRVAASDPRAF